MTILKNLTRNEIAVELCDTPKAFRKSHSKMKHEGENISKRETCLVCGSRQNSFKKSHTIPAFILRNIAIRGEVLPARSIVTCGGQRLAEGINKVNTFRAICEDCEHKFSDYENPDNYLREPSECMLNQIALKTYLSRYAFKNVQLGEYSAIINQFGLGGDMLSKVSNCELDAFDFNREFEYAKSAVLKGSNNKYYLQWYRELEYVVPVAFQEALAVGVGFRNERINDLNSTSKKYKIQDLHICIFPLQEKSVVICFTRDNENRYRNFFKKFNTLETDKQLQTILFLALAYSDRVFLSPNIYNVAADDTSLCRTTKLTTHFGANTGDLPVNIEELELELFQKYSCDNAFNLTNLLSQEYAM
jgi:hypothetical protein